ncbi:MAG: NAD(P)/FAD-dependent oxidoreductase [Gammaproteobacteria bacterium]|nr:NAD(P)/FAD-dependent oxidoreductase [Gammaproteobacteria bacterium]
MKTRYAHGKPRLVLIGNGMAGIRTLEELLAIAPDCYDISVIGEENHGNYNRIMLSPVLAGEKNVDQIILNGDDWYAQNNVQLFKGEKAVQIDRIHRRIHTASGLIIPYDKLILATGSRPARIAVPGNDLNNILTFREIRDVNRMLQLSRQLRHVAVIGGGLLGLEAANGLRQQGMQVTVVHSSNYLLNKQLDETAGRLLEKTLRDKGIDFCMNARTSRISGDEQGSARAVHFSDGRQLEADMMVLATGIVPNMELARDSGLQCGNGILVTDTLQTFDPSIYAVGECVEHRGQLFGLVAPLYDQARVCANHLAEMGIARYVQKAQATKLKITGINVFSAGNFLGDGESETITLHDRALGHYKKLVLKDGRLDGVILYGDTQDGAWLFDLIQQRRDVTAWRDQLIFGKDFCQDETHHPTLSAAA